MKSQKSKLLLKSSWVTFWNEPKFHFFSQVRNVWEFGSIRVWNHPLSLKLCDPVGQLRFVDYEGEISPAVAQWLCACVCVCVCVCEDVQMWVIIVIWADCRSHALLLSLHTHYICGHTTLLQCLITETTARDFNVTSATAAPRTYVCLSVFVIMHHFERVQPHWWLRACRQRSGSWLGTHMMRD